MPKLPNGMISIIGGQTLPGPKLLDIEIANTFPLIALGGNAYLLKPNQKKEDISEYDHVSIPPDLRLHLTSPQNHLFFDSTSIWKLLENPEAEPIHYFTFIGLPFGRTSPLVMEGKTHKWHQAMMIFPFPDKEFNSATRVFVDFFLHNGPVDNTRISDTEFVMKKMRLAGDQRGSIIGPHTFDSLQRRSTQQNPNVLFTMRMGYANIEDTDSVYLYTPLEIFQRRARSQSK